MWCTLNHVAQKLKGTDILRKILVVKKKILWCPLNQVTIFMNYNVLHKEHHAQKWSKKWSNLEG